ncbi:hypothetical protein E4U53_001906 [Claviceps sorghi]|nr:hypothetical protein E4U53_001906 [Claviceps sorghi]
MRISTNLSLLGLWMVGGSMAATTPQEETSKYESYIHGLSYGNAQRVSDAPSSGDVWFSVKGVAPDKLPHCQEDVGIHTMDNLEVLQSIAELGREAARQGKWGDVVYLYNVFSMNGHLEYARATSQQMGDALLAAVTKPDGSAVDETLIDDYVKTSTTPALAAAFNQLRTTPVNAALSPRWTREVCSRAHQAAKSACRALIDNIQVNATIKTGGPRSICRGGCCISWSANATFETRNLSNAANYCVSACTTANVSCEVYGVSLQGTLVNQCLSNRATGCR